MLHLDFTEQQIEALKFERFHHPHPRVRRKMEALLLKSQRLPHAQIQQLVDISANTLRSYLRQFEAGGVEALKELTFYQPSSSLAPFRSTLETHFRQHPAVSIKQARAQIETLTGISLSPTAIRDFLVKIGLKRRKVGAIPAKADLEEQTDFLTAELLPRLVEAQEGNRQIFLSTRPTSS